MNKILFLIAVCFVFISCKVNTGNGEVVQSGHNATVRDHVEVLYFHGKQRCATCKAIENNVEAVMKANFADQERNGDVVFKVIDISKEENKEIAERYEVTWSSLFIVKCKDGEEVSVNMTKFAFENARKASDVFKNGIVKTVNEMLK